MTHNPMPYFVDFSPSALLKQNHKFDSNEMQRHKTITCSPLSQDTYQYIFEQQQSQSQIIKSIKYPEQDLSTMKSSTISMKRPKEYCPLSKKQQIVQTQNFDKELEYLKSSQYRQYLQGIMQGAKTTHDLIYQMKENRNNDVYLSKYEGGNQINKSGDKQQNEKANKCQKTQTYAFVTEENHTFLNLLPIYQREDSYKKNHTNNQRISQLHCQPYLEDSTIGEQFKPEQRMITNSNTQNQQNKMSLKKYEACTASLSSLATESEYKPKSTSKLRGQIIIGKLSTKNTVDSKDYCKRNNNMSQTPFNVLKIDDIFAQQKKSQLKQCKAKKQDKHNLDFKFKYYKQINCFSQLSIVSDASKMATDSIYSVDFKLSKPTLPTSQGSAYFVGSKPLRQRTSSKQNIKQRCSHSGSNKSGRKKMQIISLSKQPRVNHI